MPVDFRSEQSATDPDSVTTEITIFFFYTQKFLDSMRGADAAARKRALRKQVGESVTLTNEAFRNSKVDATLTMVGLEKSDSMPDSTAASNWLKSNDYARRRRNETAADLVYALVDARPDVFGGYTCLAVRGYDLNSEFCHWGVINSESWHFNHDWWKTVLRHEVGHNLGVQHDPQSYGLPKGGGLADGSVGYMSPPSYPGGMYGTVMSIMNALPRYSTSAELWEGKVIGEPGIHEASTVLQQTVKYVASYRTAATSTTPLPASPTGLTAAAGSGQVTLSWTDPNDAGITGYELRYGRTTVRSSAAWTAIPGSGATTTSHVVTGLDDGSEYSFKVRAVNAGGGGAATEWATATPTAVSLSVSDVTASEDGTFAFAVTAAPAPASEISFMYTVTAARGDTATAAADFTAVATATSATIAANASSTTIVVSVTDDDLDETDETFTVTLSAPSSGVTLGDATATGTITDDDESPVLRPIADRTFTIGQTVDMTAVATDGDSDPIGYVWTRESSETLPAIPGGTALNQARLTFTATAPGAYTMTVTASDGNGNSDTEEVVVTVRQADPVDDGSDGGGPPGNPGGNDGSSDNGGPGADDGSSGGGSGPPSDPGGNDGSGDNDGGSGGGGSGSGSDGSTNGDGDDDDDGGTTDDSADDDDDDDRSGPGGNDDGDSGGVGGDVRASFTLDAPCADGLCRARTGVPVSFRDASSGAVASWSWSLGDGTTARSRSLEHAWSVPGFYSVSLTVSGRGPSSTVSRTVLVEAADPVGTCAADAETLCLQDSRFSVTMDWWTEDGAESKRGAGKVVHEGTNDSGLFWFFSAVNWELLVKVLDGCSVNGRMWVYGASATTLGYVLEVTDTVTGAVQEYRNEPGRQAEAFTDSAAFPGSCTDAAAAAAATGDRGSLPVIAPSPASLPEPPPAQQLAATTSVTASAEGGSCTETASAMCLQQGRYEVTVEWSNHDGLSGTGRTAGPRTDDSGLFHFFSPTNWEILIKVLDGCSFNDHHWVFAASATDVGFDLRVLDTETGQVRQYTRHPGKPARALVDIAAFPEGCRR